MPTDGSDYKRRLKFHGLTYTELRNGSETSVIGDVSSACLGRELAGDNPLRSLKPLLDTAISCLESLWASDRVYLYQELSTRLEAVVEKQTEPGAQSIVKDSIIRAVGRLGDAGSRMGADDLKALLLNSCGKDLHQGLVVAYSDEYAAKHRNLSISELPSFLATWNRAAEPHMDRLMASIYETGKPAKELLTPGPKLATIASDSVADLTSISLGHESTF